MPGGKDVVDLYGLIGVTSEATQKEIRKAYRKKALKCHPDRNPDDPNAAEVFDNLVKAYELLIDPEAKRKYDAELRVAQEQKLKWEAANAEIRAMRAKLEQREKEAVDRKRAKRKRDDEVEKRKRNKRILEELLAEELQENEAKEALRQNVNRGGGREIQERGRPGPGLGDSRGLSRDQGQIRVKWAKGDTHTRDTLASHFEKYGEIVGLTMGGKRLAIITFRRNRTAEDAFLGENTSVSRAFKVKIIGASSIARSRSNGGNLTDIESPDMKNPYSNPSNPYAFDTPTSTSKTNPYDFLGTGLGNVDSGGVTAGNDLGSYEESILDRMRKKKKI
ncbi:hypothetical protein AAMO2058_000208700 [Amorphochlora amoebiformis]|eukprot:1329344-Amorphochlora_amoeboformis.AAC.1